MNSLGLAPCPNVKCGSSDCLVLQVKDRFWAFCTVCNCDGPNAESVEAAKAEWDALPRMSTIIAWQFQAAGLALENQRLSKMVARLREKLESALDKIENIQDSDSYSTWEGVCHACGICAGCPEGWEPTDDHNCRVMLELWSNGEPLPWEAARKAVAGEVKKI